MAIASADASERRQLVHKSSHWIARGTHLLIADLFPPGRRDPNGMHAAVWGKLTGKKFELPVDARLMVASYEAGPTLRAFVETTAVGRPLPAMPLFLAPGRHVTVPLEETYTTSLGMMPSYLAEELAPPAAGSP